MSYPTDAAAEKSKATQNQMKTLLANKHPNTTTTLSSSEFNDIKVQQTEHRNDDNNDIGNEELRQLADERDVSKADDASSSSNCLFSELDNVCGGDIKLFENKGKDILSQAAYDIQYEWNTLVERGALLSSSCYDGSASTSMDQTTITGWTDDSDSTAGGGGTIASLADWRQKWGDASVSSAPVDLTYSYPMRGGTNGGTHHVVDSLALVSSSTDCSDTAVNSSVLKRKKHTFGIGKFATGIKSHWTKLLDKKAQKKEDNTPAHEESEKKEKKKSTIELDTNSTSLSEVKEEKEKISNLKFVKIADIKINKSESIENENADNGEEEKEITSEHKAEVQVNNDLERVYCVRNDFPVLKSSHLLPNMSIYSLAVLFDKPTKHQQVKKVLPAKPSVFEKIWSNSCQVFAQTLGDVSDKGDSKEDSSLCSIVTEKAENTSSKESVSQAVKMQLPMKIVKTDSLPDVPAVSSMTVDSLKRTFPTSNITKTMVVPPPPSVSPTANGGCHVVPTSQDIMSSQTVDDKTKESITTAEAKKDVDKVSPVARHVVPTRLHNIESSQIVNLPKDDEANKSTTDKAKKALADPVLNGYDEHIFKSPKVFLLSVETDDLKNQVQDLESDCE